MPVFVDNLTPEIDSFVQLIQNKVVDWEKRPAPGKWSNKEIIGHLCDSAMINLQRFVRCTFEENFKLIYEQDEWVAAQHYQTMPVDDLLQLWRLLNSQIARVLSDYPPSRWEVKCDSSKNRAGLHTVEWLAQDYVVHLKHHLKQITSGS
ncbi:MAG: DinB family protein [Bacteroidetes bacterium]|nr:DinB family protein [Bacteroidota bacterium]